VVVVKADNIAEIRPVQVGERIGSRWIISRGLQPGERVVVEGLQKLKAGMAVTPTPYSGSQAQDQS
jgi:membrane fusion protein (multidrug efflux system)